MIGFAIEIRLIKQTDEEGPKQIIDNHTREFELKEGPEAANLYDWLVAELVGSKIK